MSTGEASGTTPEQRPRPTPFGPRWLFWLTTGVVGVGAAAVAVLVAVEVTDQPPAEPAPLAAIDGSDGDVSVFPVPGTQVVNPQTQVTLRGPGTTGLAAEDVTVTGSDTEEHSGTLLPHSDGDGVSYVPDAPFEPGEIVSVTVEGIEVRGADDGRWTWRVADALDEAATEVPENGTATEDDEVSRYVSAPDVEPPVVTVEPAEPTDAAGYVALGIKNGVVQKGPMLVDEDGEPVWFSPMAENDARDVTGATLDGEPVLTWWEGQIGPGYGYGEAVVVDETYAEVARFNAGNGYRADPHELLLTDDGTAWLVAYAPIGMDLSEAGGPRNGVAVDNIVQQVDLETGAVLFEWHGIGDVALDESYLPVEGDQDGTSSDTGYDYLHVNSIDVRDDGDVLISARHTCAVYQLDGDTGSLDWRLGGRESDFTVDDDAVFLKQHDARWADDGTMTLFDNGGTCGSTTRESSRGLVLDVDESASTASVVTDYPHPDGAWSQSQGSFQQLDGGDVLLGWGSLPQWTRMSATGDVLVDSSLPEDLTVGSYRARQVEWEARPTTDPAAAVQVDSGTTSVYMSWNGATAVQTWRVSTSDGETEVARSGFETSVELEEAATADEITVEALDADGRVLGSVPTVIDAE
ncbi:arylsulfotransferase family protein [Paraoerskovia marina]|uniref:arylsulfotransferase family protein n=1 Tax=Paraoerskovia marina TaxID=545619 RepID=UPI0006942E7B|nr:arylsulfotransferase family protein [Paraoerskovia marina]